MPEQPESGRRVHRVVRIPTDELVYSGHIGNRGWRQIVEVEVDWVCPVCGGPRGEIFPAIAYDGRHRMHVDGWKNVCGHVDKYADVERERMPSAPVHREEGKRNG